MESQEKIDFESYSRRKAETASGSRISLASRSTQEAQPGTKRFENMNKGALGIESSGRSNDRLVENSQKQEFRSSDADAQDSNSMPRRSEHFGATSEQTLEGERSVGILEGHENEPTIKQEAPEDTHVGLDYDSSVASDDELDVLGQDMTRRRFEFHMEHWVTAIRNQEWESALEHAEVLKQNCSVDLEKSDNIVLSSPLIVELVQGDPAKARQMIRDFERTKKNNFISYNLIKTVVFMKTQEFDSAKRACGRLIKQLDGKLQVSLGFDLMAKILNKEGKKAEAMWYESQCELAAAEVRQLDASDNPRMETSWVQQALEIKVSSMEDSHDASTPINGIAQQSSTVNVRSEQNDLQVLSIEGYHILRTSITEPNGLYAYLKRAFHADPSKWKRVDSKALEILAATRFEFYEIRRQAINLIVNATAHPDSLTIMDKIIRNPTTGMQDSWQLTMSYAAHMSIVAESLPMMNKLLEWSMSMSECHDTDSIIIYGIRKISILDVALATACYRNHDSALVKALLKAGASPNGPKNLPEKSQRSQGPVSKAILNNNTSIDNFGILQALIDAGLAKLNPSAPPIGGDSTGRCKEIFQKILEIQKTKESSFINSI